MKNIHIDNGKKVLGGKNRRRFDIGEVCFDWAGVRTKGKKSRTRVELAKISIVSSVLWKAAVTRMMSDAQGRTGNRCTRSHWLNQSALVVLRTARGDEPLAAFGCDQPGAGALVASAVAIHFCISLDSI